MMTARYALLPSRRTGGRKNLGGVGFWVYACVIERPSAGRRPGPKSVEVSLDHAIAWFGGTDGRPQRTVPFPKRLIRI